MGINTCREDIGGLKTCTQQEEIIGLKTCTEQEVLGLEMSTEQEIRRLRTGKGDYEIEDIHIIGDSQIENLHIIRGYGIATAQNQRLCD